MADGWNKSALERLQVSKQAKKMIDDINSYTTEEPTTKVTTGVYHEEWANDITIPFSPAGNDQTLVMDQMMQWYKLRQMGRAPFVTFNPFKQEWEVEEEPAKVEKTIQPEELGKWGVKLDG